MHDPTTNWRSRKSPVWIDSVFLGKGFRGLHHLHCYRDQRTVSDEWESRGKRCVTLSPSQMPHTRRVYDCTLALLEFRYRGTGRLLPLAGVTFQPHKVWACNAMHKHVTEYTNRVLACQSWIPALSVLSGKPDGKAEESDRLGPASGQLPRQGSVFRRHNYSLTDTAALQASGY